MLGHKCKSVELSRHAKHGIFSCIKEYGFKMITLNLVASKGYPVEASSTKKVKNHSNAIILGPFI